MARHNEIGKIGEDTACKFLMKHGYDVVERNYWRPWGEIDIVTEKSGKIRFVEVKTVSCEIVKGEFAHETGGYRPEENVHTNKIHRMTRIIQTYLEDKGMLEQEWFFDVVTVRLDLNKKLAKCELIGNVVL